MERSTRTPHDCCASVGAGSRVRRKKAKLRVSCLSSREERRSLIRRTKGRLGWFRRTTLSSIHRHWTYVVGGGWNQKIRFATVVLVDLTYFYFSPRRIPIWFRRQIDRTTVEARTHDKPRLTRYRGLVANCDHRPKQQLVQIFVKLRLRYRVTE